MRRIHLFADRRLGAMFAKDEFILGRHALEIDVQALGGIAVPGGGADLGPDALLGSFGLIFGHDEGVESDVGQAGRNIDDGGLVDDDQVELEVLRDDVQLNVDALGILVQKADADRALAAGENSPMGRLGGLGGGHMEIFRTCVEFRWGKDNSVSKKVPIDFRNHVDAFLGAV